MGPGTRNTVINLVNVYILFNPNQERGSETICIHMDGHNIHLNFSLRAVLTLLPSVIVQRDVDIPRNIMPVHDIHVMIVSEQEEEVINMLETFVRCMHSRG